jgi:DNA-directed RNA polymerase specialized sigma24 family protein
MRYWTLPEERLLIELYNKGLSHKQIATTLGRSQPCVSSKLWHLKLKRFSHIPETDNHYLVQTYKQLPSEEIAEALGISLNALYVRWHRQSQKSL